METPHDQLAELLLALQEREQAFATLESTLGQSNPGMEGCSLANALALELGAQLQHSLSELVALANAQAQAIRRQSQLHMAPPKQRSPPLSCAAARVAGLTLAQLRDAGYTIDEAKAAGHTLLELRLAGFACDEVRAADYALDEAKAAGYALRELREAGYEIELIVSENELALP